MQIPGPGDEIILIRHGEAELIRRSLDEVQARKVNAHYLHDSATPSLIKQWKHKDVFHQKVEALNESSGSFLHVLRAINIYTNTYIHTSFDNVVPGERIEPLSDDTNPEVRPFMQNL